MIKVSIIIPVYNVEKYILDCLKSVASQTMTDGVECIIVDDCGQDNSITLAKEYIKSYNGDINFRIVYRDSNGGLSAARNTGIKDSIGKYLYFLDSDDEITPNCIELMWSFIEKYGDVDLVQGSFYESYAESKTKSQFHQVEFSNEQSCIKSFLLKYEGYIIPAQSRLIRKDFVLKYKLFFYEGIIHEDNYWTFFVAKYIETLCYCRERTYYHRPNPSSITRNINISKEQHAYRTIVHDLCDNIDPFLIGKQKEYILANINTAIGNIFFSEYHEKSDLIRSLSMKCSLLEKILLYFYLMIPSSLVRRKLYNILVHIYNL